MIAHLLSVSMTLAGFKPASDLWPESKDLRMQTITRQAGEKDWPFVANSGRLICTKVWGKENVYFAAEGRKEFKYFILLDTNMFQMTVVNFGKNDVLVPMAKASEIVARIRPYVEQGKMLCKHNNGPVVPGAEL